MEVNPSDEGILNKQAFLGCKFLRNLMFDECRCYDHCCVFFSQLSFMEDGFNEKLISVKVVSSLKKALWIMSNIFKLGRKGLERV